MASTPKCQTVVYARPKIPPTRNGAKVVSTDDSATKAIKGYLKSIALDDPSGTVPGWVMVFADTFVAASRAADVVVVTWTSGDTANVSEKDTQTRAIQLIAGRAGGLGASGDTRAPIISCGPPTWSTDRQVYVGTSCK
jgi:isoquinoline 1-oxidoreductase beta subunit